MSRNRLTILALLAVFAAGGLVAASAYATAWVWVVKSHTLRSPETGLTTVKFGKLKIKWEDKTTTNKLEVECKKSSGEAELKGGFPGTDQLKTLTFEECAWVKGAPGCKLTGGGVNAEELPGWSTELSPGFDTATGIRFSLSLTGCEKASFNKTWIFKGNLKTTTKNEAGKVKITLPTLAGGAEPLETEGDEASLSGGGELEEKSGGTLEVGEARGRWFNESNERFAEGVRLGIDVENVGNAVLTAKLEGVEVEVVCPVMEGEGWIENPTFGGSGKDEDLLHYKKCTMPKPAGCKIHKELTRWELESILIYKETTIYDELNGHSEAGVKHVGEITIEGCEISALNKTYSITGGVIGEPNNENSRLKFPSITGTKLKLGGATATLTAEDKIELEGGGKLIVG